MSQESPGPMLWCFIENDTNPFSVVAPVGIWIGNLKEIIREEGIDALAKDLTLWKPTVLIPLKPSQSLAQRIKNLGPDLSTFAGKLDPVDLVTEVFFQERTSTYLDVIVQLPVSDVNVDARRASGPEADDLAKLTSEDYEGFNVAPSQFAQSAHFTKALQSASPGTEIYMCNRPLDYSRVPLSLLSEIFGRFKDDFHSGHVSDLKMDDFEAARNLADAMARLHQSETDQQHFFNTWVKYHYDVTIETRIGKENIRASNGHIVNRTNRGEFLLAIFEGKLAIGSTGAEPSIQGMASYREFYRQRAKELPQYGGCRPAILIVYAGNVVGAYALAMHRDGAVQMEPLTWQMNMDCDWRDEQHRIWIYRFVRAMRQAIQSLKDVYAQPPPNPSTSYEYILASPPHGHGEAHEDTGTRKKAKLSVECWFPYPRSYERLGSREGVCFAFDDRLLQDKLLFTAIENESGKRIMVKFIAGCYGKEMHELLANRDDNGNSFAPLLYGCQNLPGGWKMVAMEYLPRKYWVTLASKPADQFENYKVKIQAALDRLWTHGWVHGDVRHHNILVPSSDEIEVRFIDFDFSGRADTDRYLLNWNHLFRPPGAEGNALMKEEHDRIMFENLFTSRAGESVAGIVRGLSRQ